MIEKAEFLRFRGFERLRACLLPHAYIVGPNSAGKSTVIEAIDLADQCLRIARRRNPSLRVSDSGSSWKAFPLPSPGSSEEDPVRHEFGRQETRVSVSWKSGAKINIVWPEEDEGDEAGFFYLEEEQGSQPKSIASVRELFSSVTMVPVISPLERIEELKDPTYVEKYRRSRLASRHFRNHLWLMAQAHEWRDFKSFCSVWLPEIDLLDVSHDASGNRLSVFYSEVGSRIPKELAWAGDGIQIWVQLLWHLYQATDAATVVLDEPEVYLHPDLQRRLVRLLDSLGKQVILASHSADVIAEAPPEGILWVDRRIGGARRANSQKSLAALSESLGVSYNLVLARSMRSRLVLASDCSDSRVLRALARHVGANNVANEGIVSLVQLRDVRNWSDHQGVGESLRDALPSKVSTVILIQAGHRPESENKRLRMSLSASGIEVRIWAAVEIENYLLDPRTIARASGAAPEAIDLRIAEAHIKLRESTLASYLAESVGADTRDSRHDVLKQAESLFEDLWRESRLRSSLVRGSLVIRELNTWLESQGYRTLTPHSLAKNSRPQELSPEVFAMLLGIDEIIAHS